jgi:acyl-CoA thioester hydrolase
MEVWRGACNAWECDELGHMNVRFYLAKGLEGLGALAAAIGMADAFAARALSTLMVREQHVKFLREARAGAPLHMTAVVTEVGEQELTAVQILSHSRSGEVCATIVNRLEHVEARSGRAFPWSGRSRAALEALLGPMPEIARPRGVAGGAAEARAGVARAEALGVPLVGIGVVPASDCDVFGRQRPDGVMGRFSDGAAHLFPEIDGDADLKLGAALLECRILFLRQVRAGDPLVLRSGVAEVGEKTERIFHWLLDPVTGAAVASAEAIAAQLDLDRRRLHVPGPEAREARRSMAIEGLSF